MGTPRRTIEARRLSEFAEIVGDRHLIRATVGPDLKPILLTLEMEPDYRVESPSRASFPKLRAGLPNRFRIHQEVADGVWTTLDLPETSENYHAVQPLGGEKWLLVRLRADDDRDENAHVYDASGRHLRSFHAGDGIEEVLATSDGQIWVSYFDEGVFSAMDLSGSGLVRLDDCGRCTFRFPGRHGGAPPDIVDCYALNVVSDREIWLCYYTDFPLVRLVDGKVDGIWPDTPVEGSHAFAVRPGMVLFAGGYDRRDELVLARISDEQGMGFIPTDKTGSPLTGFSALGRRNHLFLQTETAFYAVEVPDRPPHR